MREREWMCLEQDRFTNILNYWLEGKVRYFNLNTRIHHLYLKTSVEVQHLQMQILRYLLTKSNITSMWQISSSEESISLRLKSLLHLGNQHWTRPWESTRKKTETERETGCQGTESQTKTVNMLTLSNPKMTIKVATLKNCLGLQLKKHLVKETVLNIS